MSALVVAEHIRGKASPVTHELLSAAHELVESVALVVIGRDPSELGLTNAAADEILRVDGPEEFDSDTYRAVLEALITERAPSLVLTAFSANSMAYAPAVAARLSLSLASDVVAAEISDSGVSAQRSFFAGKVHGNVELTAPTAVLMLREGVWPEAAPNATAAPVVQTTVELPQSRSSHRGFAEPERGEGIDITTADFLVSVGRGVGEQENIEAFERLAEKLGAGFAASRPLIDAGWVARDRQVGQSGQTVKPSVYLAFGVSGASQHVAGMNKSSTIIAVNNDPTAPIFEIAHYGAVADMFEIAEQLEKLA